MSKRNTETALRRHPPVSLQLRHISEKAKKDNSLRFTSLAHLVTVEMLEWSYHQLRKDAATGVDGVTWTEYGQELRERLTALHQRLLSWQYRAQPVRRVNIKKNDGGIRPLGVPALEDKIIQRAVVTVLEAVYEVDFHPHSYGFRRGRSAHDALNYLNELFYRGTVRWVIDADIKTYFDSVVHRHLIEFLKRRVVDGSLLRLISKWLHAGVLADGQLLLSEVGTPQGSVASPLLANIYLHYVLDEWWRQEVLPRMRGRAELVRYADDFVLGFELQEDAERVYKILGERLDLYGLTLHPDKTRLILFDRGHARRERDLGGKPPTFNFLGFTHYFGKSKRGHLTYRVRTMGKRLTRAIIAIGDWCRANRHAPLQQQWKALCLKLRGHYEYYGRSQNHRCLSQMYCATLRLWHNWLSRRHGRKPLSWQRFQLIKARFPLTKPFITHSLF